MAARVRPATRTIVVQGPPVASADPALPMVVDDDPAGGCTSEAAFLWKVGVQAQAYMDRVESRDTEPPRR